MGACSQAGEAPCTIVGKPFAEGLRGFSGYCDLNDAQRAVCNIPAEEWLGNCGPLDAPIELPGVLQDCEAQPDAREELAFPVPVPTEVLRFSLLWSTTEPASVNVRSTILDEASGDPFRLNGNDLEIPGSFAPDPALVTHHGFGLPGDKRWELERFGGCDEVTFDARVESVVPPLQNRTPERATPLHRGYSVTSHWGCSETLGDEVGSFEHYYRMRVETGETVRLQLVRSDFVQGLVGTDGLAAMIYDEAESPVVIGGNQAGVSLGTELAATANLELEGGEYLVKIMGGGCPLTRYTLQRN